MTDKDTTNKFVGFALINAVFWGCIVGEELISKIKGRVR